MIEKSRYEQASRFWGRKRASALVCSRGKQSPGAHPVAEIYAGGVVGEPRRSSQRNRTTAGSGNLKDVEKQGALSRLDLLSRGWREILAGDHVCDLAQRLLDTHELRAADSLQLAAALTWCQQRPARRDFICADQQLSKAATAAGFIVLELS